MVCFVRLFVLLIKTGKMEIATHHVIERTKKIEKKGHKRYKMNKSWMNQLKFGAGGKRKRFFYAHCMWGVCVLCVMVPTCAVMSPLFWRYFEFHRHQIQTKDPDAQLGRQLLQFYRTAGVENTWLCPSLECDIDLIDGQHKIIMKIEKLK